MRHSAITFADMIAKEIEGKNKWDLIFATDMLNLAEFMGLADGSLKGLTTILYFHENQLTYPDRFQTERDYHFGMTNIVSCLAANEIWFNSEFHRKSFIESIPEFLRIMPDYKIPGAAERISSKSKLFYPGISEIPKRERAQNEILTILWVARWEHDKNPDGFFKAMKKLKQNGVNFKLNVIGERFEEVPPVFEWAKDYFKDEIVKWGFQESREDYINTLYESDIIVSTANHEFFGIGVVESIAAGCYPVLPNRLSYPEIMKILAGDNCDDFLYKDSIESLVGKIMSISEKFYSGKLWNGSLDLLYGSALKLSLARLAPVMDNALENIAAT